MMSDSPFAEADAIVARLASADWKARDAIKAELLAWAEPRNGDALRRHLDGLKKGLALEVRWEVEEVIEALKPPPVAAAAPPPEPEAPKDGRLRMSDLEDIYADPYGTVIFRDRKTKTRWFLQQVHPQTGQPVMGELQAAEVEQIKGQLKGSPYWRLGSGVS
jgi:hypothetical protein